MLTRSHAGETFARMAREMDRLFDTMASGTGAWTPALTHAPGFPLLNVWDDGERVFAEAELPGLTMQDVEVLVTGDTLTIKGRREIARPERGNVLRTERAAGAFERTVSLPFDIDAERVTASLREGVLTVTLPKTAASRPRKVEIKALPDPS